MFYLRVFAAALTATVVATSRIGTGMLLLAVVWPVILYDMAREEYRFYAVRYGVRTPEEIAQQQEAEDDRYHGYYR